MGKFVISLDFELIWGTRDKSNPWSYGENVIGVKRLMPLLLDIFKEYDVKVTFATVGFLFAENKNEMISYCPQTKPEYEDKSLTPYEGHFDLMEKLEDYEKYHFAPELIDLIRSYSYHEIGSHTFSHYYCQENGTTHTAFEDDLKAAISIAKARGVSLSSLVFPRNQFNQEYLDILYRNSIVVYRGNPNNWIYNRANNRLLKKLQRPLRLIDTYVNLTGHNCFRLDQIYKNGLYNVPASAFLRPYSAKLHFFDYLKVRRIKKSMTHAAQNNLGYHLWWHPENFGLNQEMNLKLLVNILDHFRYLSGRYNFESCTMKSFIEDIDNKTCE
jgi:peptidoglycan/xylan/chitin deacetylase (PgdA/CDA1 family)